MPVYQCVAPTEFTSAENRHEIAREFTRVHTRITSAPAAFVNVIFIDVEPDHTFTAGESVRRTVITGFIRAGRDAETRGQLLRGISQTWSRITGQEINELLLGLVEVDPTSAMEAGLILPAPGKEAEWAVENADAIAELKKKDSAHSESLRAGR
ncbi:tautomerase family protein [Nocardia fluminea]|uniref:tautomerase family protein n=1 Tax=Nocardia fluminea TaxID=134984 RepID=UPI00380DD4F5